MQTGQHYTTGGARSAWAAHSNQCHCRDTCQTPPPRLAPPAPASPSPGSWKPQAVIAISPQGACHHDKARTSRLVPAGKGIEEKPEEAWETPWSLMHKQDRLSGALLLTPVKSHALVHWERQPRRLSTQQAAGPGNHSAWYNTHLCLARLHPRLD